MMTSEQIEDLQELLLFHREQLAYALQQKAATGPNTPFLVRQAIHDNRAEIRSIKAALRAEGIEVEDELADEVEVTSEVPSLGTLFFRQLARSLRIAVLLFGVLAVSFFVISISRPQSFTYPFRIQSKQTSQLVTNAQVSIEMVGSSPAVQFTDGEGFCSFDLDSSYIGKSARVRVEAVGFQSLVTEINLTDYELPEVLEIEPLP